MYTLNGSLGSEAKIILNETFCLSKLKMLRYGRKIFLYPPPLLWSVADIFAGDQEELTGYNLSPARRCISRKREMTKLIDSETET